MKEKHEIEGNLSICEDWGYSISIHGKSFGAWLSKKLLGYRMEGGCKKVGKVRITVERRKEDED